MNNLTHKFATETGFSSIRIQKLMDKSIFPEEKFENGFDGWDKKEKDKFYVIGNKLEREDYSNE